MTLHKAASLSELKPGEITAIELNGRKIALYLLVGQPFATSDLCTHEDCPLSEEGDVVGNEVHCLCHGSRFDIQTGEVLEPPAVEPLPTYPVELRGEDVFLDLS